MSMVPLDFSFYNLTLECVKDGSIPQTRLDDAVRRILRVKFALGKRILFELFFILVHSFCQVYLMEEMHGLIVQQ